MSGETENWGALSELPGNPLMWVLILSEMLVFGAFFIGFAVVRLLHPEMVLAGQNAHGVKIDRAAVAVNVAVDEDFAGRVRSERALECRVQQHIRPFSRGRKAVT